MSKLIVLSNRVSLPHPDQATAGGLAVALQDALSDIGGVWLGWNGEQVKNSTAVHFNESKHNGVQYITCPLTQEQYQKYYSGFANNTLWPAMHDRADLIQYNAEEHEVYQQVNRLFAQKLQQTAQADDIIWIHDYHFLSVAHYCRELGMQNRIGFFLHIPFAGLKLWRLIPQARLLIQDLSQYDVIGLQTEHDQQQCLQVAAHYLGSAISQNNMLQYKNHQVMVQCYPIGINPQLIQHAAEQEKSNHYFDFAKMRQQKTIISVDRIDYSKGLIERFNALAAFLKRNPEYQQHLTDLQIACPCRMDIAAYQNLFEALKAKVQEINHAFSQDDWLPIHCIHETVSHDNLMNIYRQSDICWVNSLRDGMNLVAKEFIAAQDPTNPGVLILSKYTGAAAQMSEALMVDPHDQSSMLKTLKKALGMSKAERLARYQHLMKGLKSFDINDWRNAILKDLSNCKDMNVFSLPASKHYPRVARY